MMKPIICSAWIQRDITFMLNPGIDARNSRRLCLGVCVWYGVRRGKDEVEEAPFTVEAFDFVLLSSSAKKLKERRDKLDQFTIQFIGNVHFLTFQFPFSFLWRLDENLLIILSLIIIMRKRSNTVTSYHTLWNQSFGLKGKIFHNKKLWHVHCDKVCTDPLTNAEHYFLSTRESADTISRLTLFYF